ncbi:hypothetical protein HK100_003534 [Physocladia obscura]|uniref:Centromere protein J C-terminal domain-containing protein n=1 Tax=Physocladia obscura TaxID=109957 RepID=A0AAD5SW32_9FUNG|nr:hypothetical protein HK100_003534 [Physocladia obscura]
MKLSSARNLAREHWKTRVQIMKAQLTSFDELSNETDSGIGAGIGKDWSFEAESASYSTSEIAPSFDAAAIAKAVVCEPQDEPIVSHTSFLPPPPQHQKPENAKTPASSKIEQLFAIPTKTPTQTKKISPTKIPALQHSNNNTSISSQVESLNAKIATLRNSNESLISENKSLRETNAKNFDLVSTLSFSVKSLKREKETLQKSVRANEMIPSKHDREQIELLRHKITNLQVQLKSAETRSTASQNRLQTRIDELVAQNDELVQEVSALESERGILSIKVQQLMQQAQKFNYLEQELKQQLLMMKKLPPLATKAAPSINNSAVLLDATLKLQQKLHETRKQVPPPPTKQPLVQKSSIAQKVLDDIQARLEMSMEPYTEQEISSGKVTRIFTTSAITTATTKRTSNSAITLSYYRNGTVKFKDPSTETTKIFFSNNDYKQTTRTETVYWYASRRIKHTTDLKTNHQTLEFMETGQVEKRFADGSQEIIFSDGTVKYIYADGREESVFPDGSVQLSSSFSDGASSQEKGVAL